MFKQVASNSLAYDGQLDFYRFSDSIFRFSGCTGPQTDDYLYLTNGSVPVSNMSHIFSFGTNNGTDASGNFDPSQCILDYLESDYF